MRRAGTLYIILELVTILSNIVIGITILTFLYQGVEVHNSYLGSIVLAIGATELVGFISLKDLVKLKNIPLAVSAVLEIVLGFLFLFLKIELETLCIVWGICNIALLIVKIVNAGFNLLRQPFLNIVMVILCIIEIIFSIFIIVRTTRSLNAHLTFLGIAILIEAVILVIEFTIHRYQKI